jgi:hypothetical protein
MASASSLKYLCNLFTIICHTFAIFALNQRARTERKLTRAVGPILQESPKATVCGHAARLGEERRKLAKA